MAQLIPEAVFWSLAAAVLAGLVLLVRERRITAALRKRLDGLEDSLHAREEEARHLVETRLPALEEAQYQPTPVPLPGLLDRRLAGTAYGQRLQKVVDLFTGAADKARSRADQSAKAALKASMRALQALANEQQISISDMQERHDNPDVLQDLLEIDHANSQFGRRAQAIAVLCGSWPGRQRAASPLIDVVRGATSRIRDYRRIDVHSRVDINVISRAVEPVVLTLAELLDNATRHSQPNTRVDVTVQPAHNGTCVVIDDAGVGMDSLEIAEASRRLSGREDIDINRLGDPPQFGFAVIGVLAARYGFSVSVDTQSPYGGVRAVVLLPHALLTREGSHDAAPLPTAAQAPTPASAPASDPPAAASAGVPVPQAPEPAPAASLPSASVPDSASAAVHGATVGGLPKRRRRPAPAQAPDRQTPSAPPAEVTTPVRSADETASRMSAFARGTRSGRASSPDDEGNPQA